MTGWRFSVVIPCYNAERWIGDCLRSVAAQTHAPHEIIVVDDGSSDASIDAVAATGIQVRQLHTERAGGAGARNAGIFAASGDWIAFQDADDLWYPDHLQRARALLSRGDDVAYVSWSDCFYDGREDEIVRRAARWPLSQPTGGLPAQRFVELFDQQATFTMPASVVRRDVLVAIGGLDETQRRRHDIDMWLRAIHGRTWAFDPVASTAFRRDTPGSLSRATAKGAWFHLKALLKNRAAYDSPAMDRLIHTAARRAMATAWTDGTREDRHRARAMAWPHLDPSERLLFGLAQRWPERFKQANALRRRLVQLRRRLQGQEAV